MSQSLEFKIPEGYVFDKDNSTTEVIRFKPIEKEVTYEDIMKKLYPKNCYYINNHHTSEKQLQQLLALNKLMNVAKYLNGDWEPDWNNSSESKWCIFFDHKYKKLDILGWNHSHYTSVVFKTPTLARQAIKILGEEEIKKSLGIFE